MNPKYCFIGIIALVGVIFLFSRKTSISLTGPDDNNVTSDIPVTRWFSILMGILCILGAVVIAIHEYFLK
jgi:hypothetical protein